MGGGHRGDGVSDLPKVARRSTRASAARPQRDATAAAAAAEEEVVEEAEGETEVGGGGVGAGGMDMVVRWPEGGVVTVDWVMGLGNVLDYASRNLQPSQLPDVIPVSVADSLILAASKVCILAYWVGGWGGFFLGVSLSLSLPLLLSAVHLLEEGRFLSSTISGIVVVVVVVVYHCTHLLLWRCCCCFCCFCFVFWVALVCC